MMKSLILRLKNLLTKTHPGNWPRVSLKDWLEKGFPSAFTQPLWQKTRQGYNAGKTLFSLRPFWYALLPSGRFRRVSADKPRLVVMLVVSDLRIDPRVMREAQALARGGYRVKIIVPDISSPSLAEQPLDWGPGIHFALVPFEASQYIYTFPFLLGRRMLDRAIQEKPFAFHCHDLITAVIGLAAARKVKARCVCDFHEWWSENVQFDLETKRWIPHPEKEKRLFRRAEQLVMSRADAVITVCDSIAKDLTQLAAKHRRDVHVIRNIPSFDPQTAGGGGSLRTELAIPEDRMLLLWQGGTGTGRNIEPIIRALAYAPKVVFAIRGPSLDIFGEGYRAIAEEIGATSRLLLLDPIPPDQVVSGAVGADVGVWSLERLCKNFTYALPNKVFEYLAAGVPVIGANFPEVRKLVEGYGVGICFDPDDPAAIGKTLRHLSTHPQTLQQLRQNIPDLLKSLNAEKEWQKIVDLYNGLAAA